MSAPSDPRIHFDYRLLAERIYTGVALGTLVALLVHLIAQSGPILLFKCCSQLWMRELSQLMLAVWTFAYAFASYHILKSPAEFPYDGRHFLADCAECAALAALWIFLGVLSEVDVKNSIPFSTQMAGALAAITFIAVLRMFVRRLQVPAQDELVAALRLDVALVSGLGALLLWQHPRLVQPIEMPGVDTEAAATWVALICAAYLCWQLGLYYALRFKRSKA